MYFSFDFGLYSIHLYIVREEQGEVAVGDKSYLSTVPYILNLFN